MLGIFLRFAEPENVFVRLLVLEVRLTVEVLGFDIADALGYGTINQQHVAWKELVFFHFNDTADLDLMRLHLPHFTLASVYCHAASVVLLVVRLVAFSVLEYVFYH